MAWGVDGLEIVVYRITGPQLLGLRIPEQVCPECDLTVAAVLAAVRIAGVSDVRVRVKPWLAVLGEALRRGGWHPPVVTVDGIRFSQGVVPDPATLAARLSAVAEARDGKSRPSLPAGRDARPQR
ncbi:MAG: hypothetical protein ACP5QO_11185 [Clostridia bacterium]